MLLGLLWPLVASVQGAERYPVERFVTGNGMTVLLVENHANPMVEVRLLIRAGSVLDPPDRGGVASLAAWMFNEGAGDLDAAAFQELLDFHGIELSAAVDRESFGVDLTTLTESLDEAFRLLGLALQAPRFDGEPFQRAIDEHRARLEKDQEKPDVRASQALYREVFRGHPYARPVDPTAESLPNLTAADLAAFRARYFRAPDMVLAVAGDLTLERLRTLVETHLGGLDARPAHRLALPEADPRPPAPRLHIPMTINQTTIRLGRVGISRQDPDYYVLTVLNHILGGGFASRLYEEIREKQGLAYSVYSHFSPLAARGPLVVGMRTKNSSVEQALELLRRELARIAADGVTEQELQDARLYLTGSFPLRLDGLDKLAATWAAIAFHDRGWDYLERWPERIQAVTRDDLSRTARRLLQPDGFSVVTAGGEESATP